MTILDKILENKRQEIEFLEDFDTLDSRIMDLVRNETLPITRGFLETIGEVHGPALIAEIKKASPSKGIIRDDFDAIDIAHDYYSGGAHCFSVLTDSKFFDGSYENLISISSEFDIPCLCKEFIVDQRQICQARLAGADAILLIAAVLNDEELDDFRYLAHEYGMDVLLEVHSAAEMKRALELDFEMIGINNRDLETFEVNLDTTSKLISKFKFDLTNKLIVSESGINTRQDIMVLNALGVKGFLVGESLLKQDNIMQAVVDLVGE